MFKFKMSFAKQIYRYASNTVIFLSISLDLKYILELFNAIVFVT